MIQLPFPSTIEAQPCNVTFLTKKLWSEKSRKTTVRRAHVLGQGSAWTRGCIRLAPLASTRWRQDSTRTSAPPPPYPCLPLIPCPDFCSAGRGKQSLAPFFNSSVVTLCSIQTSSPDKGVWGRDGGTQAES